jgi:hypothetical protein
MSSKGDEAEIMRLVDLVVTKLVVPFLAKPVENAAALGAAVLFWAYGSTSSTRRFLARPSSVAFEPTGAR